jgi:hypothetical protein
MGSLQRAFFKELTSQDNWRRVAIVMAAERLKLLHQIASRVWQLNEG